MGADLATLLEVGGPVAPRMKATEGTGHKDARFDTDHPAAYHAGVIRVAYHSALPNASNSATRATRLVGSGCGRSRGNPALPGVCHGPLLRLRDEVAARVA